MVDTCAKVVATSYNEAMALTACIWSPTEGVRACVFNDSPNRVARYCRNLICKDGETWTGR